MDDVRCSMKIAINARVLSAPTLRGFSRYTINLLAELPALGVELFLYSDRALHEIHLARLPEGSWELRVAPAMPYIHWEQYWLPRQSSADAVDLLHTPFNFGLPWFSKCARVLTLHDAIGQFDGSSTAVRRQKLSRDRLHHWISRTRAHTIVTVSEYSKKDIVENLGVPDDRVVVIYEAADPRFHEPVSEIQRAWVRRKYALSQPYVFYVGGWEERKNVPFLLRAFSDANVRGVQLVLAGGLDDQRAELASLGRSLGIADSVHLLGWVADQDLPALYAEALCFVYPSKYEGFGLQLCEAMAVGCPTIAAQATCLPEILGSGGDTFSLDDPTGLAGLLARLAVDAAYRAELGSRAKRRTRDFSWSRTAERTVAVYRQAVGLS